MHGLILLAQIPFVLRIPELLAKPWFKYLLLPVCGLLAGAVVKVFIAKTIVNGPRKTLPGVTEPRPRELHRSIRSRVIYLVSSPDPVGRSETLAVAHA